VEQISFMKTTSILSVGCAFGLVAAVQAAVINFQSTVVAHDNSAPPEAPLIVSGGVSFYAWKAMDQGQGTVTSSPGFASLAGHNVTFAFGGLQLDQASFRTGHEEYYGGILDMLADGNLMANGQLQTTVDTVAVPPPVYGQATGYGTLLLTSSGNPVGDAFVAELTALGGVPALKLDMPTFQSLIFQGMERSVDSWALYQINGTMTPVPEPGAYALIVGLWAGRCCAAAPRRSGSSSQASFRPGDHCPRAFCLLAAAERIRELPTGVRSAARGRPRPQRLQWFGSTNLQYRVTVFQRAAGGDTRAPPPSKTRGADCFRVRPHATRRGATKNENRGRGREGGRGRFSGQSVRV
jgi:hypothetical protein